MSFARIFILTVFSAASVFAQAVAPSPVAQQQFFADTTGRPLAGGKICSYAAGTTTPLATYGNNVGTPNTNPVILDANGRAGIWLGPVAYKIVLRAAGSTTDCTTGTVIYSVDGVFDPGQKLRADLASVASGSGAALVGYQQSGSTLARTALDKAREIVSVQDFPGATDGAKLLAAYAALPANGGTLISSADLSFASAVTLGITKGVHLDLQGHSINCSITSGTCLTLTHTSGSAVIVSIGHGLLTYTGSSSSITALKFLDYPDSTTVESLKISGFSTSGSYCMKFDNAENISVINGSQCEGNFNGLIITNFSTNLLFQALRIELGGGSGALPIRIESQSSGLTFHHVLVQSTNTKRGVEIDSTAGGAITEIRFKNCWFENIGDATANARVFWLSANAHHNILNFSAESTLYQADAQGALGTIFEFAGDGTAVTSNPHLFGNNNGGYLNYITGTNVFPLFSVGDNPEFCDVCINKAGVSGVSWFPQTAGHWYRMWAGDGAQLGDDNNWTFRDQTAGVDVLHYKSSNRLLTMPVGVQTVAVAVAALPAAPVEGTHAAVTDSNAASYAAGIGTIVVGGGTLHVPVFFDGTNWRIG